MSKAEKVVIRGPYDGSRVRPVVECNPDEGRTRQSERDSTDINRMVAQYRRTGVFPVAQRAGEFLDVVGTGDLHLMLRTVQAAGDAFMQLPAKVRSAFDNDPVRLVQAFDDPGQRDLLQELGLVEAPVPPKPVTETKPPPESNPAK